MILDTNGLSALADGDPKLNPILQSAGEIAVPVIVLGEYRYGILRSRRRRQYEKWLDQWIGSCRILAVDEETSGHYAEVREQLRQKGQPIPGNDLWIAALAKQHALPLLSRDRHFDSVPGLKRIGW